MLTVETGEGLPGAESFASVAEADAYLGDRAKAAAQGIFGVSFGSLANMAYVAGKFETSRRREVLSFEHHKQVAALGPLMPDEGPAVKSERVGPLLVAYQDGARQGVRFVAVDKMLAPYLSAQRVQAVRA